MSIAQYMARFPTTLPHLVEFYNQKRIDMRYDLGAPYVICDSQRRVGDSDDTCLVLERYRDCDFLQLTELFLDTVCFGQGPKIFRPTLEQLFALEKMQLNIEVQDFQMPFDMICMEFPPEYCKRRNLQMMFARLYVDKVNRMFISNIALDKEAVKTWWRPALDQKIEEWFGEVIWDYVEGEALAPTATEIEVEVLVRRVMLNYSLLLDEVGIKKDGPAVPNKYNQLVKWCRKNNKHTALNRLQLQAQPIIYSLATKPIQLVRVVASPDQLPENDTGKTVAAHWRRGHYRMQPCGPKGTERKRIRIAPVIVNAHLLTTPIGAVYAT